MSQESQDSILSENELLPGEEDELKTEEVEAESSKAAAGDGQKQIEESEEIEDESNLEEGEAKFEEEQVKEEITEGEVEVETESEVEGEAEAEEAGEAVEGEEQKKDEQVVEEEHVYVVEPVDPTAPLNFTDSEEAKRPPFVLSPERLLEVERVWALYQNYNPAYTDLDNVITVKELVYLLKCLLLMTYTPEQMMELVDFVCRPPHPEGLITYEQFLRIATLRWRDLALENELRQALQVFDPDGTSQIDANYFREVLTTLGAKLPRRMADALVRDLDVGGEGVINIEDVVSIFVMELQIDAFLPPEGDLPLDEEGSLHDEDDD